MAAIYCEDKEFERHHIELAKTEPYVLVETGCSIINKQDFTTLRLNGRPDYQLIYVHSGQTNVVADSKEYSLSQGYIILYKPNERQHYTHCCSPGNVSYWVHFMGTHAEKLLNDLSINDISFVYIGVDETLKVLFESMFDYYSQNTVQASIMAISTLLNILVYLSNRLNSHEPAKKTYYFNQLKPALDFMEHNYLKNYPIKYYADLCSMSESNFSRIFHMITDYSPKSYILNKRLVLAQNLLKNTDKTIKEIAILTGFDNQLYFSRIFKKKYSISPSEYQRKHNLLKKVNK